MAHSIATHCNVNRRHGITLMEVLISIAVVAIGLLGVVSLIPVGGQQAQTGARNDRKASVGRRSFREFNVRAMNTANNWRVWTTQFGPLGPPLVTDVDLDSDVDFDDLILNPISFCIDPIGFRLAEPQNAMAQAAVFGGGFNFMPRVVPANVMQSDMLLGPACEEVFIAQDDLVFEQPDDNAAPPLQTMLTTATGGGSTVLGKRYANGRYSWFATLVPIDPITKTSGDQYRLSTVVVAERNTFQPDEVISVTGIAFPNVQLATPSSNLRVGRWIMLAAKVPGSPVGEGNYGWYRIKGMNDNLLTLAGMPLTAPAGAALYAVVIPNVVNVYTKTIRIRP
jgi:hypothetical protein